MNDEPDRSKVLFLCSSLNVGGAERVWTYLLSDLTARGISVELIAVNQRGELFDQVAEDGAETSFLDAGAGVGAIRCIPKLIQHVRSRQIASILTLGCSAAAIAAVVGRLTNIRVVLNWHTGDGLPRSSRSRMAWHLCAWLGAEVICVSPRNLRELKHFGFSENRIHTVRNGVPRPSHELRLPSSEGRHGIRVCMISRLAPPKRVDRFIEAIASAYVIKPDIHGIVAGQGPLIEELVTLRDETSAPVEFIGFHPNPAELMLASDIVCLTSDIEAAPLVLMEAAACGRPVVATDCGDVSEIVVHGVTGLICMEKTPEALAQAILKLAGNPELRRVMGEAASMRWKEFLSADAMLDGYARILIG